LTYGPEPRGVPQLFGLRGIPFRLATDNKRLVSLLWLLARNALIEKLLIAFYFDLAKGERGLHPPLVPPLWLLSCFHLIYVLAGNDRFEKLKKKKRKLYNAPDERFILHNDDVADLQVRKHKHSIDTANEAVLKEKKQVDQKLKKKKRKLCSPSDEELKICNDDVATLSMRKHKKKKHKHSIETVEETAVKKKKEKKKHKHKDADLTFTDDRSVNISNDRTEAFANNSKKHKHSKKKKKKDK